MGLITKTLNWITHPAYDDASEPIDWFAFFVLVLIASYLWAKVVRNMIEG